jgi:CRISPR-associated protein Cmr5
MPESNELTLEQKRAKDAFGKINKIKKDEKFGSKFRSYVERLPSMIVMNGLGQAMAFELACAELGKENRTIDMKAHEELYKTIEAWLKECKVYEKELIESIISSDQESYIRAQAETLAYLEWLKKFSQAYLKRETS